MLTDLAPTGQSEGLFWSNRCYNPVLILHVQLLQNERNTYTRHWTGCQQGWRPLRRNIQATILVTIKANPGRTSACACSRPFAGITKAVSWRKVERYPKGKNTLQKPNQFLLKSNIQSKLGYTGRAPPSTTTLLADSVPPSRSRKWLLHTSVLQEKQRSLLLLHFKLLSIRSTPVHWYLNVVSAAQMWLGTTWASSTQSS